MPISNPTQVDWSKPGAIGATTPNTIKATLFTGIGNTHIFGSTANTFNAVIINGSATSNRQLVFQTAGATRWNFFANGAGGEPGSDGGSTFTLSYYTDGGVYKGDVFASRRSDGAFFVYSPATFTSALKHTGSTAGFFSATAIAKPTVTGSRSSGAALVSLLSALSSLGLITDTTTA